MVFSLFSKKHKTNIVEDLISPNGRIICRVSLQAGHLEYMIFKDGKVLINKSILGLEFQGENPIGSDLSLVRVNRKTIDETWETIVGEEKVIHNFCNEAAFYFEEVAEKRLITLRFRVFNDGVAFRYEIPPQPKFRRLIISDESTEFNVDVNNLAWKIPAYQPDRYEYNYECVPVYNLTHSVHTPLTIRTPENGYLSIHEAALYDYGEMSLKLDKWHALKADIAPLSDGLKAYIDLPFNTPWRVVMIADRAIDLINNHITLNLNDPPKQDFSWVRPLKFMGIWWAMFVGEWTWAPGERHGATTEHAEEYIRACQRLNIKGLLVEGWNHGWDGDWLQNGIYMNFKEATEDYDFEKIAQEAHEAGIEIVGHHETVGFVDNYEKQMEEAYQFCAKNNIHYIKSGYAGSMMMIHGQKEYHHSQVGVKHYQKALELAAKYHIMLDVHEPIKGTGIERTWPNLLTREGARGQEYEGGALSPSHACILPFTRLLAGGMDYTSGIFDVTNATKRIASTLARQLAFYVTIYSGMQMAADRPVFYEEKHPEAYQFIRDVPVNWERTVPLIGEIGQYYVVARQERDGSDWYIGGVNNEEARRVRLSLEFLDDGEYVAEIYRDADTAHYRDNQLAITIEAQKVTKSHFLDLWLAPGGGFAVRLKKV